MQDLEQINRANAEAVERSIPKLTDDGKFVVAEYHGLRFFGFAAFDTEREANSYACQVGNKAGVTTRVFQPTKKASTK